MKETKLTYLNNTLDQKWFRALALLELAPTPRRTERMVWYGAYHTEDRTPHGACNLTPEPVRTELTDHVSVHRRGQYDLQAFPEAGPPWFTLGASNANLHPCRANTTFMHEHLHAICACAQCFARAEDKRCNMARERA